jgi:glycosyltransferase involved in cell wall biosynthesis
MRVLHFGNVAMNGYNNAKLLRRLGVDADAICDETHLLSQPEWEEAEVSGPYDALVPLGPDVRITGWDRPAWVISPRDPIAERRFRGQYRLEYASRLATKLPRLAALFRRLRADYDPLRSVLGTDLQFADVLRADRAVWMHGLLVGPLEELIPQYDVIQAYATHPTIALLADPERPMIAYEHGTMRELPFEDSWRGRMLSVAYRRASKVIITNADMNQAAARLGLTNTAFIPHPVDETRYTPGPSAFRSELEATADDFVILAPARHDWREKANDRLVRAVSTLVKTGFDRVVLVLADWGTDTDRAKTLVTEEGLDAFVRWYPPLPKRRLIDAYRAADVVADQFVFGTFGGIAPEGMACGKPVVMAFDEAMHEWCFEDSPPIVDARDERSIAEALRWLAESPSERHRLGAAGRVWMERYHGWKLVAERQRAIYDEVLGATA